MNNLMKFIAILVLSAIACFGQATLATTTLGAAVTTTNQTNITLASTSTMLNRGDANQINTVLYVDNEFMWVTTVVDSTHVTVARAKGTGKSTRPEKHVSGATVYFANTTVNAVAASYFYGSSSDISGACTATSELVLPRVYLYSANIYDCMGGVWVQTDAPGNPSLGSTVASPAGVMTATGTIFLVSGTNAVTGITVPNGFAPGMALTLIPTGAFTTTTATNIRIASTAVVGKALIMTWDGSKWDPSY